MERGSEPLRRLCARSVRCGSAAEEAAVLAGVYVMYEFVRGFADRNLATAIVHARDIVRLEQAVGIFVERQVQHACGALPLLAPVLAVLYPMLHLGVTSAALVWLYRRRQDVFVVTRSALVITSALALVTFLVFPVAPPRLAVSGFVDKVTRDSPLDLTSPLVSVFYDPVAAVPSVHVADALLVAGALGYATHRRIVRLAALAYPCLVVLVVVATGNHFFFDALTGAAAAAIGFAAALLGVVRAGRRRSRLLRRGKWRRRPSSSDVRPGGECSGGVEQTVFGPVAKIEPRM